MNLSKEGGVTNPSVIISANQLLNTLGVKALLALGHRPGLSGENTKFVAEEGSSQEGNHSWDGSAPFICQQKSAGKYRLPCCQQKIEMPFFFLGREFILQWLVSSGDKHHLKEEEMPCFRLLLGDGFVHLNSS